MLLADLGAEVLRISRRENVWPDVPIVSRGRADLVLDLKSAEDRARALDAIAAADVVVEGFRPGVMERLGLGPAEAQARNPRLVYARMTGWGQQGPLAPTGGHDINYIAVTGALSLLSRNGAPPDAPLNLLGDYAGGSLFLIVGVLAALVERQRSGLGQIIDAAIVDGATSLTGPILGMAAAGLLDPEPTRSMLSGSASFYRTYRCADGKDIAVGPLEGNFRAILAERLGVPPGDFDGDQQAASEKIAAIFAARPRDHWTALCEGSDACLSPVLSIEEARQFPHIRDRGGHVEHDGIVQPAPAPRFSRTPGAIAPTRSGEEVLKSWLG
jgi:alpha-methylacyl-CoA racemase